MREPLARRGDLQFTLSGDPDRSPPRPVALTAAMLRQQRWDPSGQTNLQANNLLVSAQTLILAADDRNQP